MERIVSSCQMTRGRCVYYMYTIIVPDQPRYSILVRLKRLEKLNKSWALRRTRDNDNMKYFMVRVINQL